MPQLNLYFDETGSRHPDKKSDASRKGRDWFALGGVLVNSEDEEAIKQAHSAFCGKWKIHHPLHMTDMLACRKAFSWLGKIPETEHDRFWREYKDFLSTLPVRGIACVIDRPGYVARGYIERYGDDKWLLCRSAFDILVERSAKIARTEGRKLGVTFEQDAGINDTIRAYFHHLKAKGLAFDQENSKKYSPMTKDDFSEILSTIEYKGKSSKLLQIADSYVYAIARSAYEPKFHVFRRLRDARRIVNFCLPNEAIPEMGVKFYCFDAKLPQNKKAGVSPGLDAAPIR